MRAGNVMTRQVVSVSPETPILEAAGLMAKHNVSGLPVVDTGGRLVGIVTESDFLRPVQTGPGLDRRRWIEVLMEPELTAAERLRPHERKVKEIMTTDLVTVREDTPLDEAVRLMGEHNIKRLLVTRHKELVGIVSRADLLGALPRAIGAASNALQNRQHERTRMAELERQLWMHRIKP
jgi:CBS domain-containing protein